MKILPCISFIIITLSYGVNANSFAISKAIVVDKLLQCEIEYYKRGGVQHG